MIFSLVASRL